MICLSLVKVMVAFRIMSNTSPSGSFLPSISTETTFQFPWMPLACARGPCAGATPWNGWKTASRPLSTATRRSVVSLTADLLWERERLPCRCLWPGSTEPPSAMKSTQRPRPRKSLFVRAAKRLRGAVPSGAPGFERVYQEVDAWSRAAAVGHADRLRRWSVLLAPSTAQGHHGVQRSIRCAKCQAYHGPPRLQPEVQHHDVWPGAPTSVRWS